MVELAVAHAGAGAHPLHVAGTDHARVGAARRAVAHAVLVRQLAAEHVADDLHVAVAVRAEAGAAGDAVLVDDAQGAQAHPARVVIVREREAVEALEPAVVGVAAIRGLDDFTHVDAPCVAPRCGGEGLLVGDGLTVGKQASAEGRGLEASIQIR